MDSRDPDFFRCQDLSNYVKENGIWKENFLLVNKSDLLSEEIRQIWSDYFNKHNINHVFFSAKAEQESIEEMEKLTKGTQEKKSILPKDLLTENTQEEMSIDKPESESP